MLPGYGDIGLLQCNVRDADRGADGRVYAIPELGGTDQEQVLLLARRYQDVVLVLTLLLRTVLPSQKELTLYRDIQMELRERILIGRCD